MNLQYEIHKEVLRDELQNAAPASSSAWNFGRSNLHFYEIHNLNQRNVISTSDILDCQSRRNKLTQILTGWTILSKCDCRIFQVAML